MPVPRRAFLGALTASALASRFPAAADSAPPPSDTLVMDAMGELRMDYEEALIRDMLGSGLDSITITLCDPKPVGAEALELATDSLLQHDRYLAAHPAFFVKAVQAADVDRARREGKLAVFYLYQNTAQFGRELDRVDLFYRLGLRSCQLTYNDKNDAGAGSDAQGGLTAFGRELIARMKALLKRAGAAQGAGSVVSLGGLRVDAAAHTVQIDGETVNLSPKEFDLLAFFVSRPEVAFTRDQLLNHVWGYDFFGDARTVDTHVKSLREKLGPYRERIVTVWGTGYRFSGGGT